jgi:hypothetical protein
MRTVIPVLGVMATLNLALLGLSWRRNQSLARKIAAIPQEHAELIRRLVRSHLAAKELLEVCSPADAAAVSSVLAARRQDLASAVAAVGEFAPYDDPDAPESS